MIDERTTALASRYVLGTASAEERRDFEAALRMDRRLQLLVKELRGTQGSGPTASDLATATVSAESAVEPQLEHDKPGSSALLISKTSDWLFWSPWVLCACFAALCLLLVSSIQVQREKTIELANKSEQQSGELARLRRQNAQLQKTAAEQATNRQQWAREFESNLMKGVEQLNARTKAVTNQLDQQLAAATRELANARKEIAEMSNAKIALEHAVALLGARDRERFQTARLVALRPASTSELPPSAAGAVWWSPSDQRGLFFAENLRLLPATQAYQLWLVQAKASPAISGGLIPSGSGSVRIQFTARSRIDALERVFVTIESAIGASAPGERIVLSGE
jgi:anti-sigma-K factor RskA